MTSTTVRTVPTFRGDIAASELGFTLIHEHVFVREPALELDMPHPEWNEDAAINTAVRGFERLIDMGVRTVVDLTVLGLGRDVALVQRVAERTRINIIAATGYYTAHSLPNALRTHGPNSLVGGPDPLVELFVRDIERGIAGSTVRAGMLKVVSEEGGITPDVERVFRAAAIAHAQTGVPITTHSHPASRGGLEQQRLLSALQVPLDRVVIGHSGDSTDVAYLRELADEGSWLGFDRFGMEHMGSDDDRIRTLLALIDLGYSDRIVVSHDAAFFSRVTPPSWRAATVPNWHMEYLSSHVLPRLRDAGVDASTIHQLTVDNPSRVLSGAS